MQNEYELDLGGLHKFGRCISYGNVNKHKLLVSILPKSVNRIEENTIKKMYIKPEKLVLRFNNFYYKSICMILFNKIYKLLTTLPA